MSLADVRVSPPMYAMSAGSTKRALGGACTCPCTTPYPTSDKTGVFFVTSPQSATKSHSTGRNLKRDSFVSYEEEWCAECRECVMPKEFLEQIALDMVTTRLGEVSAVTIDDPREPT